MTLRHLFCMGLLTTHVLDTAHGSPARGLRIELFRIADDCPSSFVTMVLTNDDGRCDAPLLEGAAFTRGVYQLEFHAGEYFRATSGALDNPAFLDVVPVRFGIAQSDDHYHVPLLISPYSYSTYRGS